MARALTAQMTLIETLNAYANKDSFKITYHLTASNVPLSVKLAKIKLNNALNAKEIIDLESNFFASVWKDSIMMEF